MTDEDELLAVVRDAWAETLGIDADDVPIDEGFFDAGGNSLLLVMLWEQLCELTGTGLRATDLFQHPTVRAQVELLAGDL
ncbi:MULTISPECIES: acyl carrier protein [unclassified Streptomyces]|uniref:acyl carrier protein n=1 Tax=unclassified Streptomyces TaxID=2593676 RepID=UPI002366B6AF|nr:MULTISPECIES: acyl carrier protein [unclassified Streptomyces]MDF3142963.1 acyl carrier protein [Streptomyces sp. T21Q-yed]WDF42884.1 acyl carrier protein [Streptomyces sp. T12]